jgi:hypothetical protein
MNSAFNSRAQCRVNEEWIAAVNIRVDKAKVRRRISRFEEHCHDSVYLTIPVGKPSAHG